MGLELLKPNPADWAELVHQRANTPQEADRREIIKERVHLYRDDYYASMRNLIRSVFLEPAIAERVEKLLPMIGGTSFLKRVADDLARPVYATAPQRRIQPDNATAQDTWARLADELEFNSRMDDGARLLRACNAVFFFVRYIEGLGMRLDLLTGDQVWVIPHPEVPLLPLAITYERPSKDDPKVKQRVTWDDKRWFVTDKQGTIIDGPYDHTFGLIPIVDVHVRGRTCEYWDLTSGNDLVAQTKNSRFLDLIICKKLKSQSHLQLAFAGDTEGFAKDQVSDEESVLISNGQGELKAINLESDPTKILEVKKANEAIVASNYGLAAERNDETDDALRERVSELAAQMVRAEGRLFTVIKAVAEESPDYRGQLPEDSKLLVDLGALHHRVDRMAQLTIRQTERSMGLRSGVDDVLEDNPEFWGDRERALRWIDEKMSEEATIIAKRRALNMPEDASTDEPGQTPQQNGAMGPEVRDGELSKDEAALKARVGPTPKVNDLGTPKSITDGEF